MGSLEDDLAPAMTESLDLFGETVTIQNWTHNGTHPQEGTAQWTEDSPFDVQGVVYENQRPMEEGDASTQQVSGEYHIYVESDTDVRDGRISDTERASEIIDSDGNSYDIIRVTDEHNGLIRCQGSMEDP